MFPIDTGDAIASMPTPAAAGTPGWFRASSDPAQTTVTNDWANGVQAELINLITALGFTPSKTVLNQVLQALMLDKINYNTTTGTANTYVLTNTTPFLAYVAGMKLAANINVTNTDAATLNVDGLGAVAITREDGSPLQAGDIIAGQTVDLRYNGTAFELIGLHSWQMPSQAATVGYIVIPASPKNIIWQWGSYAVPAGGNELLSYPLAFPTSALQATTSVGATSNSSTPKGTGFEFISNSQFRLYNFSASGTFSVSWHCIGN